MGKWTMLFYVALGLVKQTLHPEIIHHFQSTIVLKYPSLQAFQREKSFVFY
jgi:hypothetical protein